MSKPCPECHADYVGRCPHCGTRLARILACGCVLGRERCMDCRPGIHPDQETALAMTMAKRPAHAPSVPQD